MPKSAERHQEELRKRKDFQKEYSGTIRDIVSDKGFQKLDKKSQEQLRESAQRDLKAGKNAQVTIYRSKDGKERIVVRGNK